MGDNVADKLARLSRMTVGELRREWRANFHEDARSSNRVYLHKRLSWQIQAEALGGLSKAAQDRLEALLPFAPQWLPMPRGFTPAVPQAKPDARLQPGSIITRTYRGRTLTVLVRDGNQYEFEGRIYDSLSSIVKDVTGGSHQSGPRWFGLKEKRA